jgi:hypothetical protein
VAAGESARRARRRAGGEEVSARLRVP